MSTRGFTALPCSQSSRTVDLNSRLKENSPDQPVCSEEWESMSRLCWWNQLHVITWGWEPLKEKDGESRGLNCYQSNQHPRKGIKRFWKVTRPVKNWGPILQRFLQLWTNLQMYPKTWKKCAYTNLCFLKC